MGFGVLHHPHVPVGSQIVVADAEEVEIGDENHFRPFNIPLHRTTICLLYVKCKHSGRQFQDSVPIRLQYFVRTTRGLDPATRNGPQKKFWRDEFFIKELPVYID